MNIRPMNRRYFPLGQAAATSPSLPPQSSAAASPAVSGLTPTLEAETLGVIGLLMLGSAGSGAALVATKGTAATVSKIVAAVGFVGATVLGWYLANVSAPAAGGSTAAAAAASQIAGPGLYRRKWVHR